MGMEPSKLHSHLQRLEWAARLALDPKFALIHQIQCLNLCSSTLKGICQGSTDLGFRTATWVR